jgi:hypothetical protein
VHEIDGFVKEVKTEFAAKLDGVDATGTFTLIFMVRSTHRTTGPLEAVLGCLEEVTPTDRIGIRTEPAHDEAYTTITCCGVRARHRCRVILHLVSPLCGSADSGPRELIGCG